MWKKRLLYIFLTVIALTVLCVILGTVRDFVRRAALAFTAERISCKYFAHEKPQVDFSARTVVFSAEKSELLRSAKLDGKVTLSFPVKFFELPWHVNLKSIAVDGVSWELDLQKKTLNNHKLQAVIDKVMTHDIGRYGKFAPDLITYGNLKLINPEGKVRSSRIRSILKRGKDYKLLGVYAGDMKVNFLYNEKSKQLLGQYQAQQSDFEFFRLSFGLPELFTMHGVGTLSGQILYDFNSGKLEYIRGSANFGSHSSIQGAIFSLYGSRKGRINWEYLNSQNWQIEFRDAESGKPFRTKLHYLVLSQNTMEHNSVNFDGEIEFYPTTFRNSFGLEFDRRTAALRHRLVGKWNMNDKSWELSRLDAGKRVPQVRLKWNDFNIAFQSRSFKLAGTGAQSDHFAFRYELEMANADWKDKNKNAVITSHAKLEGDCILSLSDDTLKPFATGKLSCELADGAFENTRFLLKNVNLNFSPDAGSGTKYKFSIGNFSVGIPDLRNGVRLDIPRLQGEKGVADLQFHAPVLNIKYRELVNLSSVGAWDLKRVDDSNKIVFNTSALHGEIAGEKFKADRISATLDNKVLDWDLNCVMHNLKAGLNTFSADTLQGKVSGERTAEESFVLRKFNIKPINWKFNSELIRCSSPASVFEIAFAENKKWRNWKIDAGQFSFNYGGCDFNIPNLVCSEENRENYSDGIFNGHGSPYRVKFSYSRPGGAKTITLKNGSIDGSYEFFRGLTGEIKLFDADKLLKAALQFDEVKIQNSNWEHGELGVEINRKNGFELASFSGNSAKETSQIKFIGKTSGNANEFEVRNFPAKYVENTLKVPEGTLSGLFDGRVTVARGVFFNPFKIQTFYLKNNQVMRLRFGVLEKYAQIGNSIEDKFAADAVKDFFAKSLVLDYHRVGKYNVLDMKAVGKSVDLLPYEFDVKEKKLKKSEISLFNSEVEVIMKYMK